MNRKYPVIFLYINAFNWLPSDSALYAAGLRLFIPVFYRMRKIKPLSFKRQRPQNFHGRRKKKNIFILFVKNMGLVGDSGFVCGYG